jgi:nucleoside 2-deoxyribosyltransferase
MKIYLAHNFKARWWLRDYKALLESMGHEVTSRWVSENYPLLRTPEDEQKFALQDFMDIDEADALILFTDQYGDSPGKGKFMEYGYAYAKGKQIYLHGQDYQSSIFYYLPGVVVLSLISALPRTINTEYGIR